MSAEDGGRDVKVGDRVKCGPSQQRGVVKFVGVTDFSPGEWIGVVLDKPEGKNNGTVKDKFYFDCPAMHGLFCRHANVVLEEENTGPKAKQSLTGADKAPDVKAAPLTRTGTLKLNKPAAAKRQPSGLVASNGVSSRPKAAAVPAASASASLGAAPTEVAAPAAALPEVSSPASPTQAAAAAAAAAPSEAASAPESPGQRSSSRQSQMVGVPLISAEEARRELAEAMEDHDVDRLQRALPAAAAAGAPRQELDVAARVLNFEVQRLLSREVQEARSVVMRLADAVTLAEARAEQVEQQAASMGASINGKATTTPGESSTSSSSASKAGDAEAWINQVGVQLEERVWQGVQRRVEETVRGAVAEATKALLTATQNFREVNDRSSASKPATAKAVRMRASEASSAAVDSGDESEHYACTPRQPKGKLRKEVRYVRDWWLKTACARINGREDIVSQRRGIVQAKRVELNCGSWELQEAVKPEDTLTEAKSVLQDVLSDATVTGTLQQALKKVFEEADGATSNQKVTGQQLFCEAGTKHWKAIFDSYAAKDRAMELITVDSFIGAMRQIHSELSAAQALAMWKGFKTGANVDAVDWDGFHAMVEAVAAGDECASEFADMAVEPFQMLGLPKADDAAVRLQARARGNKDRKVVQAVAASKGKKAPLARAWSSKQNLDQLEGDVELTNFIVSGIYEAIAKKQGQTELQGVYLHQRQLRWKSLFEEVSNGSVFLDMASFTASFKRVHPEISSRQAEAVWTGTVEGTGKAGVDKKSFCAIIEALEYQGMDGLSQFADLCLEDFEALAEPRGASYAEASYEKDAARWRTERPDIAKIFDSAIASPFSCLTEAEFVKALPKALPTKLTTKQVGGLWSGYIKGTERSDMTLEDFCAMVVAGENSEHALAEFADMSVEAFQNLGDGCLS
jgi:hypothetical protein